MKSNRWLKRQSKDVYVKKAKKIGFLSRAAYKLIEIDKKYKLILKSSDILELGASPGSWSQVIININDQAKVEAFDTINMKFKHKNIKFNKIDFLEFDFQLLNKKYDLILSDLSPNTTGHKQTDHLQISSLLEYLISILDMVLKKDSNAVFKIFKGTEEKYIFSSLKKKFKYVEYFKPKSSRKDSSEIYMIGKRFLYN